MTISHRGNSYAIGSGQGFYGIWLAAVPGPQPVEWWPQTPQGWQDAWYRFTSLETSDAIVAVGQEVVGQEAAGPDAAPVTRTERPAAGTGRVVAPALLVAGVAVGIAGLFPGYLGGASLAQQADELVPHLIYLAAWAGSAALLLAGGSRRPVTGRPPWLAQVGALAAIGTSAVTFGLFLADLGTAVSASPNPAGAGLFLSLVSWLICAAASLLAVVLGRAGSMARPRNREGLLAVLLTAAAGLGAAIAFAPSWDSYTLKTSAGVLQSVTAGNAFANPALVIVGDVAVMVLLVAAVIAAALWRPARLGAALLAGAAVPLLAQAISAVIQVRGTVSPLQFGLSQSEARQAGLTIASGLTPAFWIYCAFVAALVLIGARMLTTPAPAPAPPVQAGPVTAGVGGGVAPVPGSTP